MIIGGFVPTTLIDYPGKVASLVFTKGCNFHCPYCHNPDLVPVPSGPGMKDKENQEQVLSFLDKRRKLIDGVVITGGEPTLQKNLVGFLKQIKRMGLLVKLDTNGSRPQVLRALSDEGLVDYIAMDIKTAPENYMPDLASTCRAEYILSSIDVIMNGKADYEFRTTCVKPFVDMTIMNSILKVVMGAKRYALQTYRPKEILNPSWFNDDNPGWESKTMEEFKTMADRFVTECLVR